MNIKVLNEDKNFLELLLEGQRHTVPNLLKSRLAKNPEVEFVSYKLEHPLDKAVKFVIRTAKKDPKKVLIEACKEIESELEDFGKKVEKAMK